MTSTAWAEAHFEERFWANVEVTGFCWNWVGYTMKSGYGQTTRGGGKKLYTHRIVYELLVGPIPEGLVLDHLCMNKRCCNPDHLEPVTDAVNVARSFAHYRNFRRPTKCRKGHEYTPENTIKNRETARQCRTCSNQTSLARYYRRKAAKAA